MILRTILNACFLLCACAISTYSQLPTLIGMLEGEANTKLGWEIVPLGDQNSDGFDDILARDCRDSPTPIVYRAKVFLGGAELDTVPNLVIEDSVFGGLSNLGDLNGDGFSDFSMMRWASEARRATVYFGGPLNDGLYDVKCGTIAFRPTGRGVRGLDIDANGVDELLWKDHGGRWLGLFEFGLDLDSSPYLTLHPPNLSTGYSFADDVEAADLNGDGRVDIATNRRYDTMDSLNGQVYVYFGGASFDTIPNMIITRPGDYAAYQNYWGDRMTVLDYNGDGFTDLYVGAHASDDSTAFIFFGGPTLDTLPDVTILGQVDVVSSAGDVNNDGYEDLIRGNPVAVSGAGEVQISLGGPGADSLPDVRIRNTDVPGIQYEFGLSCTGIGDFNGDGVDDFAFSAYGSLGQGIVFIYAGGTGPLHVDYDYEPTLPSGFTLSQNYPNPFNAGTQIQFGLPEKSEVQLAIFNILGEEVRTVIDRELSAGAYRVEWDGRDNDDAPVASGVYLYRLTAGNAVESKKMMLLK